MELHEIICGFALIVIVYKIIDQLIRRPKLIESTPTGRYKNILVTGCDSGFGNTFAKRMASKGFTVFACCLTEEATETLSKQLPGQLKPFVMDVSDEESVRTGYEYVCSELGNQGLWAIVNNAGKMGIAGPMGWFKKSHYTEVMDVNLYGILQVSNRFLPLVKKTKGRIVNTVSIVGRYVLPYSSPYAVSKHAAEALSDTLRLEMLPFGVSVHIIEPGFFDTGFVHPDRMCKAMDQCWESMEPDTRAEYGEKFLKAAQRVVTKFLPISGSRNWSLAVDCYEHAVTAKFPRARYMPGYDARFFCWPMSFAPEWISDGLINLFMKLAVPSPAGVSKYKQTY